MADFELFNTVYNAVTFVAIFCGILIIALANIGLMSVVGYHFTRWTPPGQ